MIQKYLIGNKFAKKDTRKVLVDVEEITTMQTHSNKVYAKRKVGNGKFTTFWIIGLTGDP